MSIHSPFRYAGGKFYARKLILEHVPAHSAYIEPFAGGASLFFAKPKIGKNHLNDKDKDIMNVYKVIRDKADELITMLTRRSEAESGIPARLVKGVKIGEMLPASKELHAFFKHEYK